jgi:endoglucanase
MHTTTPGHGHGESVRLGTLLELTAVPTAAGREGRVIEWIRRWAERRENVALSFDAAGNVEIRARRPFARREGSSGAPVYIAAHLDHPAFVVERALGTAAVEVAFRGGVMDAYFERARVRAHPASGASIGATLTGETGGTGRAGAGGGQAMFKTYAAELDAGASADALRPGDVVTWDLPGAELDALGVVHAPACDDLAAAAAALDAFDRLLAHSAAGEGLEDVRLLFTRAEEIGFVGAIAACRLGTIARGARVIALENSRFSAEAPIGGGPIVRVGDRMSVFTPSLTNACAKRAEQASARPAQPLATQTRAGAESAAKFRWQRRLMSGGACEATVFCAHGYEATCLCLPLGNYHNMSDLDLVQEGRWDAATSGPPRVAREFIGASDYAGLVELLTAIGRELPGPDHIMPRIESLYATRGFVLNEKP